MNKYEMVLIAAREARRMNDIARLSGSEFTVRPTTVAWQRLMDGKLEHTYEPIKHEEKPVEAQPNDHGLVGGWEELGVGAPTLIALATLCGRAISGEPQAVEIIGMKAGGE